MSDEKAPGEPSSPAGEGDLWAMEDGTVLSNVHPVEQCAGRSCSVHNPSEHHMREWPQMWSGSMARVCEHGRLHPDPDATYYLRSIGAVTLHVCCGCCLPPGWEADAEAGS